MGLAGRLGRGRCSIVSRLRLINEKFVVWGGTKSFLTRFEAISFFNLLDPEVQNLKSAFLV